MSRTSGQASARTGGPARSTGPSATGGGAGDPIAERLLASSARVSYDPDVDLDWDAPLVDGAWFMQPERISIHGTPLWESLSRAQQVELSRHEVASLASVGVWFELILMQMVVRDLYDADPRTQRMHYALTELADECRHSLMFGKMCDRIGTPAYGPPRHIDELGRAFKTVGWGVSAYAAILVAEEVLDRWQRELMKDERVQPLMRAICRIHVVEEARHITFAKQQIEEQRPRLGRGAAALHRNLIAQVSYFISRAMVNPRVYEAVGIPARVGRRAALANPAYRETMTWNAEKVIGYLREQDLIGRAQLGTYRRALLVA